MERLADYIRRVAELESKVQVGRTPTDQHPPEQNTGGDCTGQRDSSGDRQDRGPLGQPVRQAE